MVELVGPARKNQLHPIDGFMRMSSNITDAAERSGRRKL